MNISRRPEVSLAEPWGSVRSTLRTYDLENAIMAVFSSYCAPKLIKTCGFFKSNTFLFYFIRSPIWIPYCHEAACLPQLKVAIFEKPLP